MSSFNKDEGNGVAMEAEDESCVQAMLLSNAEIFPFVLKAAIELNLFEIIAQAGDGAYFSPSEIASRFPSRNSDAPSLIDRILRLLASHGLLSFTLRELEDGRVERLYGLAPACRFLLRNDDGSCLASMVAVHHHQAVREVWLNLKDVVLEGGDHFQRIHGMNMFEYMEKDPTLNKAFNEGMAGMSTIIMKKIMENYKGFEGLSSLADVGGGTGAFLNMIVSKYPSIKAINFDLPHVLQTAPNYTGIENVGGSMLVSIPKAEAIILQDVLHNWSDEHCFKILSNCYEALPKNGKVIVIDLLMPEAPDSTMGSQYVIQLDNTKMMLTEGKERTTKEFEALCKGSGFSDFQVICYAYTCLSAVMEFHK